MAAAALTTSRRFFGLIADSATPIAADRAAVNVSIATLTSSPERAPHPSSEFGWERPGQRVLASVEAGVLFRSRGGHAAAGRPISPSAKLLHRPPEERSMSTTAVHDPPPMPVSA